MFFITLIPVAFATDIQGTVTDSLGHPVAFASVFLKGTPMGSLADDHGSWKISAPPGSYTLVCRSNGYSTLEKPITVGQERIIVDLRLSTIHLTLKEVVISAKKENPAIAIMKKVIEKRGFHEHLIKTRETDVYLKGSLKIKGFHSVLGLKASPEDLLKLGMDSNGNGIVYLLEEVSHYTYKAPDKEFNKVISVREAGDPHGLGFASMPAILNIYKNNVDVFHVNNRGFISPANNGAFHYYNFEYMGSFEQYGRTIDKIKVTPKRKFEPLFSGYVYVAEEDWVFQYVDLFLTKESQISGIDTIRLKQSFEPLAKDIWPIQNQVLTVSMRILGIGIGGSFLTVYQNQKINQPVDESLFTGKIIAGYATDATKKDSSYWAQTRPVPIAPEEQKNFVFKDSVYHAQKLKRDSLNRVTTYSFGPGALLFGNPGIFNKRNEWTVRPLTTAIQFNSVEGVSGTLDLSWKHTFKSDSSKYFMLNWLNRYGFGNRRFNSLAHLQFHFDDPKWKTRWWDVEFSGGKYIYQFNGQNPIMPVMNELYTLLGGRNYMKLYGKELIKLSLTRNWGNGLKGGLEMGYEKRNTLENVTQYSFKANPDFRITQNNPFPYAVIDGQKAFLIKLGIQYQPGKKYIRYPEYKWPIYTRDPVFTLNLNQAVPLNQNFVDYLKWRVGVRQELRLHMLGRLDYRLAGGGFLYKNRTGFQDWNHINGNQTFLAAPYLNSFQLAPYYRFSNLASIYGEGHLQWHLNGLLTNKIPILKRLNWFLVAGTNILYIDRNDYYAEATVGLENIGIGLFRFGRVDFIAGYESGRKSPSLGVRVGFNGLLNALFKTQQIQDL